MKECFEKKNPLLAIKGLSFHYEFQKKKYPVLKELNLRIEQGESVGLIGANGVGKSTFLKLLVGLLELEIGEISICGIAVEPSNYAKIRSKIGYVFQDSNHQLFSNTVYDDVAFGPRNYGLSQAEVKERTENALKKVNILPLQDRQIHRLSGGEKKLAAIATILSMEPELILFDEPTVALDPRNRRNLVTIVNDLPQTKIIASHDLDFIEKTCERTILLYDGKIIADGPSKDILHDFMLLENHGL